MINEKQIVSQLKDIEFDFQALVCMSGILADILDRTIGQTSKYDEYSRVQITDEELEQLAFAWNDVRNRSEALKRDFMSRLYPKEASQ
ncbi:hypothetical protein WH297_12975 [Ochrobactrum vermis]|uniref:Uncharacterized protein n=1 Tax=Ochrobactrum vermis TaxID=1827297 RepID=A0ABU8PEF8_9HYPH|nr:hypothetical protein [Ochrobactrum vermis]PQZ30941.1 hypothetical protein CQZ93_13180 [Ochrobactrum vermis]